MAETTVRVFLSPNELDGERQEYELATIIELPMTEENMIELFSEMGKAAIGCFKEEGLING